VLVYYRVLRSRREGSYVLTTQEIDGFGYDDENYCDMIFESPDLHTELYPFLKCVIYVYEGWLLYYRSGGDQRLAFAYLHQFL
jgi:hypothetical protein